MTFSKTKLCKHRKNNWKETASPSHSQKIIKGGTIGNDDLQRVETSLSSY